MIRTWVDDVNTTNLRILVSIVLAILYVLVVLGGTMLGKFTETSAINTVAMFLLAMMGLDVAQFIGKRFSDTGYAAAKQGTTTIAVVPDAAIPPAATSTKLAGE